MAYIQDRWTHGWRILTVMRTMNGHRDIYISAPDMSPDLMVANRHNQGRAGHLIIRSFVALTTKLRARRAQVELT